MLRQAWKRRVSLRLVSLKLSNVYDGLFRSELPLTAEAQHRAARERLAVTLDELRRVKGWSVVQRGHDLVLKAEGQRLKAEVKSAASPAGSSAFSLQPSAFPPVPLRCHSHYSFLDSTLSPTDIVQLAKQHGLPAVALTDTGNL